MTTRYDQMDFDPRFESGFQIKQAQEFDEALLRLRRELALVQFELSQRKAHHARELTALKYRPDQPRVPPGNPTGGQWARGGGGGANPADGRLDFGYDGGDANFTDFLTGISDSDGGLSLSGFDSLDATGAPSDSPYRVTPDGTPVEGVADRRISILEEDQRGGHTYEKHVNQSEEELLRRVRDTITERDNPTMKDIRSGSFPSLAAADRLVNATLARNQLIVELVISGKHPDADKGVRVDWFYGAPTGIEAYAENIRQSPVIRIAYGVGVYIRRDSSSPNGFKVVSAYPRNP